jgi:hypothetical protein
MTIPQESGGQTDTEMTGATSGIGYNQALQGLDGDVHRVPAISLVGKGVDGEDQTMAGELALGKGPPTASKEMEVDALDGKRSTEISPVRKGPFQSLMVFPRISWYIPINEAHLAFINSDLDAIKGIKNTCPCSGGNGETFVSVMVNHRNQGEFLSIKVCECIQKFYEYLHKADPTATINFLCNEEEEDSYKFVPITEPSTFPSDMLGLCNYIQICNLYTTSPANGNNDEGNPKFQHPTYVVIRVATKYTIDHIVGLIQLYLTEMNMFVKEKEMPSLNTRTRLAIIGTTANWCPVSLRKTLHKDLGRHVENLQMSGWVDTEFCHHRVPAFLLWKNKMQMPKMNSLISKQDVEFIDYYERLHQCIIFELADEDWDWFKLIIIDYVVNGHLKWVISCQASILELPHGPQSNFMMVCFLKSIKLQMLYAHYIRTIGCNRVQSLDYMIRVEVEQGEVRPYKNTNLCWEVPSMRLPSTQAEGQVLGNTFIDEAHMLLADPAREQLRLLYQNSEVNEQFVSYFAKCLCAHIYQYLRKEKHFTHRCCQAILGSWFEAKEGLRAMDSRWYSATYRATPLQCLPHQACVQDMAKLCIVDIVPELLQEMSDRSKHKQQFNMEAMQKVADHMNLKPPPPGSAKHRSSYVIPKLHPSQTDWKLWLNILDVYHRQRGNMAHPARRMDTRNTQNVAVVLL